MQNRLVVLLVALLLLSSFAVAEDNAPKLKPALSYMKGRPWFPVFWAPYSPMDVPNPDLQNSGRVNQLTREGKLVLSLSDAIALALENNLDIAIQRDNPKIADLDILRTRAGSSARGVRTSVTSASTTSGGGAGAQGGTGTASGGVGQGTGGLTTSTLGAGSAIGSFDPVVTTTMQIRHQALPVTDYVTQQFLGINATQINTGTANFAYQQAFHSGTAFSMGWNNNRRTNLLNTISPQISSNFQTQFSQHLLQGFGFGPNTRNIRIAQNNREVSDLVFKQQVMLTVTQVQNTYWDLVSASEDVKVKESSVTVAEKLYNDNKRQVEIGTLAPIEIVRAEAQVASTRQDLIVSQTVLQQYETNLKNMVLRDLSDPALLTARVVPTDRIAVPPVEPVVPIQESFGMALSSRPELAQSRIDLRNRDISFKAVKNGMLPTLDAFAYWGGQGTAGLPTPFRRPGQTGPNVIPSNLQGGLGNVLSQSFGSDFPDYAFGLQLSIPLRNRSAQADAAQAQLENGQAVIRLRQLENAVRVEVQNAVIALQQNRARLEAAQKQRFLQEQTLDAEQKKFQLGASTIFLVIQAQRDLAVARSAEVKAMNDYMKSRVEMDRATGQTINKNGISMDEAYKGQITRAPQGLPVSRQN
jgi:outer membrane protein TolC